MPARLKYRRPSANTLLPDLARYAPTHLINRHGVTPLPPPFSCDNTFLEHTRNVVTATEAALRLIARKSPISKHHLFPKKKNESSNISADTRNVINDLETLNKLPLAHHHVLQYHPVIRALLTAPLCDENGAEIPSEHHQDLKQDDRVVLFNLRLDAIRHRMHKGHSSPHQNLQRQLAHFERLARKNHKSVVTYINQLLRHEPLLRVVPLQTGYYPNPYPKAPASPAASHVPALPLDDTLRIQQLAHDRKAWLREGRKRAPMLFRGMVGYLWHLRWSPEQSFFLHWWLLFNVDNACHAVSHGIELGEYWRSVSHAGQGVALAFSVPARRQATLTAAQRRAFGWIDAKADGRVPPAAIKTLISAKRPGYRGPTPKARTRLEHLQAMVDAEMGIDYYLRVYPQALLQEQKLEDILAEKSPRLTVRTLGKGQAPKSSPPPDGPPPPYGLPGGWLSQ